MYLDILLGDKFNWGEHLIFLCQKLTKILSAFNLMKKFVPTGYRQQLYYSYHFSQVTYGIEVSGKTTKSNISNDK